MDLGDARKEGSSQSLEKLHRWQESSEKKVGETQMVSAGSAGVKCDHTNSCQPSAPKEKDK